MKEEMEKKIKAEIANQTKEQLLDDMLETNKTNLLNLNSYFYNFIIIL